MEMLRAIGLMSGTSLDGVDAAWLETDGVLVGRLGPSLTLPYDAALRADLRRLLDRAPALPRDDAGVAEIAARLTERHVEAVRAIGMRPLLTSSSTDANAAMWMGLPAITIGGGGSSKDAHALTESFDSKDSWKGPQYVLLLLVALAQ